MPSDIDEHRTSHTPKERAYNRRADELQVRRGGELKFTVLGTRDLGERFRAAKSRSEERVGRALTHAEFVELLLNVWEEHEEPRAIAAAD